VRVLVPLPFDVSDMVHGRNLRIVHLLRELNGLCELMCVTPDERLAEAARGVLPDVRMVPADDNRAPVSISGSYWVRRAIGFFGYDQSLLAEVAERAASADVVLGFDLRSAAYLLAARGQIEGPGAASGSAGAGPRTVCDLIDDPWLSWQSFPPMLRWSLMGLKAAVSVRVIQRRVLGTFDALAAVAPRDAASLSRATGVAVSVVPNGVEITGNVTGADEREWLVVFTGTMHFPPNQAGACYLARKVWPRVLRRFNDSPVPAGPSARPASAKRAPKLAIVGADPTPSVRRLADRPGVTVTGRVEDLSAWLKRARVAAAPMTTGCGVKNKVLEACAAGCPVVCTPLGAAGLPTGRANGIIVADTPQRIADALVELLVDVPAARSIGKAGRSMVRRRFSWSASARALLGILGGETWVTRSASRTREPDTLEQPRDERFLDEEALIHAAS